MSRRLADLLFRPRSVVVYGASSDPDKLSGRPLAYLRTFGYAGVVYAVNPRRDKVQGVAAYSEVADVPGPVDLAVIVVPADSVVDAVEACADAGVGAAIIFASGFAEVDLDHAAAQDRLATVARRSGIRVLGPNCLGSFAAGTRAFATFSTAFDEDAAAPDSPIALVSQSGAVGTFTYSMMTTQGLGVRYFANTGNECDVTVPEILAELVDAPDVQVLMGHMEGVKDEAALEQLARGARRAGKPLVLLKAGRTSQGARAAAAHTASDAGDDKVFDRLAVQHGAIRVRSMEAWADAALAFAPGRRAAGRRLTIVTLSGGAGVLATDAAVELGLQVDPWPEAERGELASHLPYFGSTANPIDVTGSMINDVGILQHTLDVARDHDGTDAILVVLGNAEKAADDVIATLTEANAATDKPMFVSWTGGSGRPRAQLLASGLPTYPDPDRAVRALVAVVEHSLAPVTSPAWRRGGDRLARAITD